MRILTDKNCEIALIRRKTVAIIGYGNQGRGQALNLRDSGVKNIIVGSRKGSRSARTARRDGFKVFSIAEAARRAGLVMMLLPDEVHGEVYKKHIAPAIRDGAALGFAHGFSVHFGLVKPKKTLDVLLVAPKGPGKILRALYEDGLGMIGVVGVGRNATGQARKLALAYAAALGCGRAGIFESSFAEECETDLFSEQAILCGGMPALIKAGFEALVKGGYAPEIAYIECLHEVKQIADLMWKGGLDFKNRAISNTAEFGGFVAGQRLISSAVRKEMTAILGDIRAGRFARKVAADHAAGFKRLKRWRAADARHPIERAGRIVRARMPWLKKRDY
ncbi:MAG TPA: ketol-acid reductoisomerase [Sphingomonadales bacterium]|nr:ketol-acid reductoisomerase [Sphingomonadales bacterium]